MFSDDDLTIIECPDHGWSQPMTLEQRKDRGTPYYCDVCGKQVSHYVTYHPSEVEKLASIVRDRPRWDLNRQQ
jgi:hypothetical protein